MPQYPVVETALKQHIHQYSVLQSYILVAGIANIVCLMFQSLETCLRANSTNAHFVDCGTQISLLWWDCAPHSHESWVIRPSCSVTAGISFVVAWISLGFSHALKFRCLLSYSMIRALKTCTMWIWYRLVRSRVTLLIPNRISADWLLNMFLCSFRDAAILVACVDEVSMIRREVVMTLQKLAGVVTLDVSCNLCARTCYIYTFPCDCPVFCPLCLAFGFVDIWWLLSIYFWWHFDDMCDTCDITTSPAKVQSDRWGLVQVT